MTNEARYLAGLVLGAFVIEFGIKVQGLAGGFAVGIPLVMFPLGWLIFARAGPAKGFLWAYLTIARFRKGFYFERDPKRVHGVERRTLELLLTIIGMSAYLVGRFTTVSFLNQSSLNDFVALALGILILSSFLLVTSWVFEDAGFRSHSSGDTTLGIPFGIVKGFLTLGGLGTYIAFSRTFAGSFLAAGSFTFAMLAIFGPACYLICTLYDDKVRKKAVDEVRKLGVSKGIPLKSMTVT